MNGEIMAMPMQEKVLADLSILGESPLDLELEPGEYSRSARPALPAVEKCEAPFFNPGYYL